MSKLPSYFTDLAHIFFGFLTGILSHTRLDLAVFYTLIYFIYQYTEHIIIREDDIISDLREFMTGLVAGYILHILFYIL